MAVRSEAVAMARAVGLLDSQISVNQTNYWYSTYISRAASSGALLQKWASTPPYKQRPRSFPRRHFRSRLSSPSRERCEVGLQCICWPLHCCRTATRRSGHVQDNLDYRFIIMQASTETKFTGVGRGQKEILDIISFLHA